MMVTEFVLVKMKMKKGEDQGHISRAGLLILYSRHWSSKLGEVGLIWNDGLFQSKVPDGGGCAGCKVL